MSAIHLFNMLLWLPVWIIVMAVTEYTIHRWIMHRKRIWVPASVFDDHVIEHHNNQRTDINIDLPVYNHLVIGSPLLVASYLMGGWASFVALIVIFCFHSYAWTKMHRGMHGIEQNWMMKTGFYWRAKLHHLLHNKRPGKNFGIVFLFVDTLFRTKV